MLGEKIKKIRLSKNMSKSDLSILTNITRATLLKIENYKNYDVKLSTLKKICKALDCSITELLGE